MEKPTLAVNRANLNGDLAVANDNVLGPPLVVFSGGEAGAAKTNGENHDGSARGDKSRT